jgi:putative flippase GtrA
MNFLKKINKFEILRQAFKFTLVGIISTIADIGVLRILISLKADDVIAIGLSFFIGVIINYMLHGIYTFQSTLSRKSIVKYFAVIIMNYLITNLIIFTFKEYNYSIIYSKLISIPFIAINGFILSKYWIYKYEH